MDKNLSFSEKLEIGNNKEYYVNDLLNVCGIPCKLNNLDEKTEIDLHLFDDELYIDVKYLENVFNDSKFYTNIDPYNCLIIDKGHVKKYNEKSRNTGFGTWIAFLINFDKDKNLDLRFIKTDSILKLVESELAVVRSIKENGKRKMKINLDKNYCMTMVEFSNFLYLQRQQKKKQ